MEYQRVINLLDNTPNQPSKLITKLWVETNDESSGNYNKDNQIRFKASMLRSNLCDYKDAYVLVKGTIAVVKGTIAVVEAKAAAPFNANKKVILKKLCSIYQMHKQNKQYASKWCSLYWCSNANV